MRKSWRYLLKLDVNLNKKRLEQTSFMYIVKKRFSYLIEKLTITTNIDINKRDNKFESSLERIAWTKNYLYFDELLLNYEVDVQVDFSLLNVIAKDRSKLVKQFLNHEVDVNILNEYKDTSLRLLFEQEYFDSKISNYILQMLIVAKTNINETYDEIFLLCLQILEVEACSFFDNYYQKQW